MSWSSLAFLIIGTGIGVWVGRKIGRSPRLETLTNLSAHPNAVSNTQTIPPDLAILDQLKQTELAYQMASEMSQFQAGFLARTSHELRSPINSVISLHQLILADLCESPEEEREYIAQASQAAQRMLSTLDEIVTVSKVQHGRVELQMQPVNLKLIIDDAYQITHLQAQNRNIRLNVEPPDADLYVFADPTRLRQVVVNLIDRAIAELDSGHIYVTTEHEPETELAAVMIADDRPETAWAEAIELLQSSPSVQPAKQNSEARSLDIQFPHTPLPPGLTLFADQALMTEMDGKLELVPNPKMEGSYAIRCSIPVVEPEE